MAQPEVESQKSNQLRRIFSTGEFHLSYDFLTAPLNVADPASNVRLDKLVELMFCEYLLRIYFESSTT